MEIKNDEFQELRLKVDQISSELDKQNITRVVNTKWMVIVGAVILAALGFTNFVQVPREAANSAKEAIGPEIIKKAKETVEELEQNKKKADTIMSSMYKFDQVAEKDGYAWVGSIKFVWGTRKSTSDNYEPFLFKPNGKSDDEYNFKNKCFTVITSLPGDSFICEKTSFKLDRINAYGGQRDFTFVAIGQ